MLAMIVDDDILVCRGLQKIIPWEKLGFQETITARNGEEGMKLLLSRHPDLVITDIKMPVMDGLELCKRIHAMSADISIILMSAYEDFEYARQAIRYGVKNYLLKPIDQEKVHVLIDEINELSSRQLTRQSLFKTIYDSQLERGILDALETGNRDFINELFENRLPQMFTGFPEAQNLCVKLLYTLYQYLSDGNTQIMHNSMEHRLDDIIQLKTADLVLAYTYQLYLDIVDVKSRKRNSHALSMADSIKKYIEQNYADPNLSVATFAELFHVTTTYISMIFKEASGSNLNFYITDYRLKKACELLCLPEMKVADVSSAVGYLDTHYFSRVFKSRKGITPSAYRSANLK